MMWWAMLLASLPTYTHSLSYSGYPFPAQTRRDGERESGYGLLVQVTPTYEGHIDYWVDLMTSIVQSLDQAGNCAFRAVSYLSVVSTDDEKAMFQSRFSQIVGSAAVRHLFSVRTLQDVLLSTRAPIDMGSLQTKWKLQSAKKMFGCLAGHNVTYAGSQPPEPDGVCFVVDSESYLVNGGTVCGVVTEYLKSKNVFYAPFSQLYPKHKETSERSRGLLLPGQEFGEFYAMVIYHWVYEMPILNSFLLDVMPRFAAANDGIFIEEAFYHWLYPHRSKYNYSFINGYDELVDVIGQKSFYRTLSRLPEEKTEMLEVPCYWMAEYSFGAVDAVGQMLQSKGIRMARCDIMGEKNIAKCNVFKQHLLMCVSTSPTGPETMSF